MENVGVLREWFGRVDSNHTGNITAPQLQRALAVGNLDFPLSIVQQMIRMYDFDRNGTMNFEEFLALNKFLLKVDTQPEVYPKFMPNGKRKVQNVFSALERGRGFLPLDDVYAALVKLGFSLDSPAFYTVCESFDKNKMGMVRLDEFISLCIFVQSACNLFNSFDTPKQGRVTLDFNQFVYCTANCRI
uniref:Sorcin isoform X2 n=1 Tax=Elaeis guineensis var. tenera TaxID=51953 RepID=A0A6I9SJM2_ELAGV|nr:sorcin isoform X2 [Elaeis guineensis]